VGGPYALSKRLIKNQAKYQYTTFDNRMRVWIWNQIIMVEVSGDWTPEIVAHHLRLLWDDFIKARQKAQKVFLVVDCNQMKMQNEAFRHQLKTEWELLFNRSDVLVCLIEKNTVRRNIRQSIMKLLPGIKNIRTYRDHQQAFRLIRTYLMSKETEVKEEEFQGSTELLHIVKDQDEKANNEDFVPKKLTIKWINDHSHIRLTGTGMKWIATAWRNIIFLKISQEWAPEEVEDYVNRLSVLPAILTKQWDRIFFVFDLSRMKFKIDNTFRYLRPNLIELHDREDMEICVVLESKIRRLLFRSMYTVIGKLDKLNLFADCDEAFSWVREQILCCERTGSEIENRCD
jgi:hypothetical protein